MRRGFIALGIAISLGVTGALTGCTAEAPQPTPSASETVPADPALAAKLPADYTPATAETETVRLADAIGALLPASIVKHVDNAAQLVPASAAAGSYYGVLRHITIDPTVDPVLVAKSVGQKLVASGWSELKASDTDGVHLITLVSGSKVKSSWFIIVSGDPRTVGQSVVSIQLASPDLP